MMKRYIYLIENQDNGYIKIGIGKSPENRIKQLQTGSSAKLKLLYKREVEFASKVESVLHYQFKEHRVQGEWFDLPIDNFDEIDKQIGQTEQNYIVLKEQDNPFI